MNLLLLVAGGLGLFFLARKSAAKPVPAPVSPPAAAIPASAPELATPEAQFLRVLLTDPVSWNNLASVPFPGNEPALDLAAWDIFKASIDQIGPGEFASTAPSDRAATWLSLLWELAPRTSGGLERFDAWKSAAAALGLPETGWAP